MARLAGKFGDQIAAKEKVIFPHGNFVDGEIVFCRSKCRAALAAEIRQ
jgi:hypothetical protein